MAKNANFSLAGRQRAVGRYGINLSRLALLAVAAAAPESRVVAALSFTLWRVWERFTGLGIQCQNVHLERAGYKEVYLSSGYLF